MFPCDFSANDIIKFSSTGIEIASSEPLTVEAIEGLRKLPYRQVQKWLNTCGSLKFRAKGLALEYKDAIALYGDPVFKPTLLKMTVHGGGRGIYVELEEYGNSVKLSKFLERGGSWMERVYRERNGTKRIPPAPFTVRPENPEETLQSFFDANKRNATPFYVEYGQNFEPRRASRIDGIHNFRNLMGVFNHKSLSCGLQYPNINQAGFAANMHSAIFAMHREEACMWSLNGTVYGAPRIWGLVHKRWNSKLIELGRDIFGDLFPSDCPTPFSHFKFMISPDALRDAGIPANYVTQCAGDYVVTYDAFHFGINTGPVFAIAAQVSGNEWLIRDYEPTLKCPTSDEPHHDTLQLGMEENRLFADILRQGREKISDAARKRQAYARNPTKKLLRMKKYYRDNKVKICSLRREKYKARRQEINATRRIRYAQQHKKYNCTSLDKTQCPTYCKQRN